MDFYSTKERNKLIQEAMDSYKYKDLPLEIDDFFAIHKSVYVYKVVKNRNELRLLKLLPVYFVHGDYYDRWVVVDDKDLKYKLKSMSKYSDDEKEKRFNLANNLKDDFNIITILIIINKILKENNKMLNLSICINLIYKIYDSYEFNGYRYGDIIGIISLRDTLKHLS
jgi:hypothetical protein